MNTSDYEFAYSVSTPPAAAKSTRPLMASRFLSLGIARSPLLCVFVEGLRGSITGQIAVKLSVDSILDRAQQVAAESQSESSAAEIVRESFKAANVEVYGYGHRMGAGGKMGATALVGALAGDRISVARVGKYEGFLLRDRSLLPLFEEQSTSGAKDAAGMLSRFLGANSQILVDLASAKLKNADVVVLTTAASTETLRANLQKVLSSKSSLQERANALARSAGPGGKDQADDNVFFILISIGRPAIVLREVVEQE